MTLPPIHAGRRGTANASPPGGLFPHPSKISENASNTFSALPSIAIDPVSMANPPPPSGFASASTELGADWILMYRLSMATNCFLPSDRMMLCGTFLGPIHCVRFTENLPSSADSANSLTIPGLPPIGVSASVAHESDDSTSKSAILQFLGHKGPIRCLSYLGTGGHHIVSAGADHTVRIWDVSTTKETLRPLRIPHVSCLGSSVDGKTLLCGTAKGTVLALDPTQGILNRSLSVHLGPIKALLMSPTEPAHLYSAGLDGLVKCIHLEEGRLISLFEGMSPLRSLFAAPNAVMMAGTSDGCIRGYDARTARCVVTLLGHSDAVLAMDGKDVMLVSGSDDGSARQWDIRMQQEVFGFMGHGDGVNCVKLLPNNNFVTGSLDKTVRIWELRSSMGKGGRTLSVCARDARVLSELKGHFLKHAKSQESNGTSILKFKDFQKSLKELGLENDSVIEAIFKHFDLSGDGCLDPTEMLAALEEFFLHNQEEVIANCFKLFDADNSGVVSIVELQLTLSRGPKTVAKLGLTQKMITEVVGLLKGEAGGDLDIEEFRGFMMTRPSLVKAMFPVVVCDYCRRKGLGDFKIVGGGGAAGDGKASGKADAKKSGGKKKK